MSSYRSSFLAFRPTLPRAARALGSAILILAGGAAQAQQPVELRSGLDQERSRTAWLTGGANQDAESEEGIEAPPYRPYSEGAETGDDGDGTETPTVSGFPPDSGASPLGPPRPVTTALERRAADRKDQAAIATGRVATGAPGDEEEILTGATTAPQIDAREVPVNRRAETPNPRAEAIEAAEREDEADPYAPLGMSFAGFTLYPSLEQGLGFTSNADYSPEGGEAILSETTLRLDGASDWSRHAAEFAAYATLRKTIDGEEVNDPSAGFSGRLRLDLVDGFEATGALGYTLTRETASSAVVLPGVVSQPLLHRLDGEIGISRETGRVRLGATATVGRLAFADAELAGGGTLSQEERNQTFGTLTLRTGYAISPALVPFLEAEAGRRIFDDRLDSAGYARSAERYGLRAGLELDLGEKFSGEISGGWIVEAPQDDRLAPIEGISAAAALSWSPVRGTSVSFDGDTTVETTTEPGRSGSIYYSARLGLEREVRANLTVSASAGLGYRDYAEAAGEDLILDLGAGLTWWLNRHAGLTGRASYQTVTSTLPGRDTETATLFLGMKLRR